MRCGAACILAVYMIGCMYTDARQSGYAEGAANVRHAHRIVSTDIPPAFTCADGIFDRCMV